MDKLGVRLHYDNNSDDYNLYDYYSYFYLMPMIPINTDGYKNFYDDPRFAWDGWMDQGEELLYHFYLYKNN